MLFHLFALLPIADRRDNIREIKHQEHSEVGGLDSKVWSSRVWISVNADVLDSARIVPFHAKSALPIRRSGALMNRVCNDEHAQRARAV